MNKQIKTIDTFIFLSPFFSVFIVKKLLLSAAERLIASLFAQQMMGLSVL